VSNHRPLRQGDVLLVPGVALPAAAKPVARDAGRVVLAYGEVTGHAHAVLDRTATLYQDTDRRFLEIVAGLDVAELTHEEHGTITLTPDTVYEVRRQREYWPEATRNIAD
jgi:hypothetical protein